MVFTTRLSGGKGRNGLETELRKLGVTQKNSRPNHPTTCGKVERFQQTMQRSRPHTVWERKRLRTTRQPRAVCGLGYVPCERRLVALCLLRG
ncbi:hypothetical protein SAMN05421678_1142 [Actinopolymorpha cephalotaxi]|uniref:Transposase InsO family protein n=1 Tax=Actinopolymorpha cephalotaxi TaxID=504797 RepID=A0A1I2YEE0_9ACTN|nr:transposase InsO family protein [Actinopolymorpha cephalotaxi]SFH22811.1 hypothetical protein SAMN05421678_1142 [Actinopolymorpha cephalotaxi]